MSESNPQSPFSRLIKKAIGKKDFSDSDVTEENIISLVNEGHEQGILETNEAAMINNIFDFVDKEAGDIMTVRENVISIDRNFLFIDALKFMLSQSFSRYPVYEDNVDHIIGILYLKDAMRIHAKDESINLPVGEVKNLLRKAMVIPETMNINDLFKRMQSKKIQMAIVVDEYGQTRGLVTMEDILEEIVGNIMDEYDIEERHIRKNGKDGIIVDGLTALSELENRLKIKFPVNEFETINGFMISKLQRLPEPDEKFTTDLDGYRFEIVKVENRTVSKISVKKIKEEDNE